MAGSGDIHVGNPDEVLTIRNLLIEYKGRNGQTVHAVSDVSLGVRRGETLGLVGESGCGKSTTGRAMVMLGPRYEGSIQFDGHELKDLSRRDLRSLRKRLQIIFQDPASSLNSRRTVRDIVSEGLAINNVPKPWQARVDDVLLAVGLDPAGVGDRRPRQLSGGQCQRVAIARALILDPTLVVCDEPVSALDVSVQAQILNLLEEMKDRYSLTLVFIAHDLAVVKSVSDRIAVMYLGKICEVATSEGLCAGPLHPYTRALLSAIPDPDPDVAEDEFVLSSSDLPSPLDPPSGCRFRTRCILADDRCTTEEPVMRQVGREHFVACHRVEDSLSV